jgi:hypothetical protein
MNSNTGTTAIDELRANAAQLLDHLPKDVFPAEPPNNERNGYWKWCPVCGFEFLFPGTDRDPKTIHCEGCGGEVMWNGPRDMETMSETALLEFIARSEHRLTKKVNPRRSVSSSYFMECDLCEYRFLFQGNRHYTPARACSRCGAKIGLPETTTA